MSDVEVLPEVKEIVGAVLFAAKQPVSLGQLHGLFKQAAQNYGGLAKDYEGATPAVVRDALAALREDLEVRGLGFRIIEVANGYRLETDTRCGPWLRQFLEKGRPTRLSRPALETLAIVAYRQPCLRSEIEAVRGVAVDQILRNLLDMQLIRIVGRSELPGRPWLFATTQRFLEHFGLKNVDDLPGVEELRRMEHEQVAAAEGGTGDASPESSDAPEPSAAPTDADQGREDEEDDDADEQDAEACDEADREDAGPGGEDPDEDPDEDADEETEDDLDEPSEPDDTEEVR